LLIYMAGNDQPTTFGPRASLAERVFVSLQSLLISGVEGVSVTTRLATAQNGVRLFLYALALAAPVVDRLIAIRRREASVDQDARSSRRTVLQIQFGLCVAVWIAVPVGTLAFVRIDQRVFPYVLLLGLAIGPRFRPKMSTLMESTVALGACCSILLTVLLFVHADRVFRGYHTLLMQLPRGRTLLDLAEYYPPPPRSILGMLTPHIEMPYWLSCYYPLAKGGLYPALFDTGPIRLRQEFPSLAQDWAYGQANRFDFSCRRVILDRMQELSRYYDTVLLWGASCIESGGLLEPSGYVQLGAYREMSVWVQADALPPQ
jgi:hypothetical protein